MTCSPTSAAPFSQLSRTGVKRPWRFRFGGGHSSVPESRLSRLPTLTCGTTVFRQPEVSIQKKVFSCSEIGALYRRPTVRQNRGGIREQLQKLAIGCDQIFMLLTPNDKSSQMVKKHGMGSGRSRARLFIGYFPHGRPSTEFRHSSLRKSKQGTVIAVPSFPEFASSQKPVRIKIPILSKPARYRASLMEIII